MVLAPPADGFSDVISYISQLALDDIESLQERSRNKGRDEEIMTDEELAMMIFAEEAEGLLNIRREHISERSNKPCSMLQELLEMEEAARYDHQVALAISEDRPIPPRPPRIATLTDTFQESDYESDSDSSSLVGSSSQKASSSGSRAGSILDDDSDEDEDYFPQYPASSKAPEAEPTHVNCTVCGDDLAGMSVEAPCGHFFDISCLETMFRKATIDESLYPPKCCMVSIPVASVRPLLDSKVMSAFEKKSIEFDTPSRVYCFKSRCSAFLGATTEEPSELTCSECSEKTCGSCKAEAHPGVHCSDTEDLNSLANDLQTKQGWQRCHSCHHMVEKSEGCYHITCICKAQFCYLCAAPWKECGCPQFEVPPELR
ncbi:hypothetical protein EW026_g7379 [Hermanssonia centrifuga]|uniref:RBR-type E3 ubiquitin transferase n=1 Tax=Hermanssonia centrifuga TaxID=98765 RepID=A0A4S4K932_9APHY|nr:hypothetical protein EW026_g7379 [Hermanssonia centrifuga]